MVTVSQHTEAHGRVHYSHFRLQLTWHEMQLRMRHKLEK